MFLIMDISTVIGCDLSVSFILSNRLLVVKYYNCFIVKLWIWGLPFTKGLCLGQVYKKLAHQLYTLTSGGIHAH